ncbi:thioesterase II family protein [Streptomyces sp. NBC_01235]|uniref:thioesterase II family protein n=1 Tax=Streptomyces sp. NBC_01235 TaxID=2903788 RepID=UPI002E0F6AB4|nr:alpha/beta fold hydrolase [Streptomyces sp. NBC_01235]
MSPVPLVLLHHSGGSAQVFQRLVRALPQQIAVHVLELPGRGRRWREKSVVSAQKAADDLAVQVAEAGITGRFAIFGHSMGACLGLLLASQLEATSGGAYCDTLFASAGAGPFGAYPLFDGDPQEAEEQQILDTAARFGGLSPQILAHEQLRERSVELLRADFAVCDDFVRMHRNTVTESRIVVCHGTDDFFTAEQLDRWRLSTTAGSEVVSFPGDHFYITDHAAEVAATVSAILGTGPALSDRCRSVAQV